MAVTRKFLPLVAVLAFITAGCSDMNNKEQRALSGGAIGAGAGAVLGWVTGANPWVLGAIGAAGGAAVGALTDESNGKRR
jgi:osmotically inducible lipoprotein OsmB